MFGDATSYIGAVNDTTAANAFASGQNGGASVTSIVTNSPPHGFKGVYPP